MTGSNAIAVALFALSFVVSSAALVDARALAELGGESQSLSRKLSSLVFENPLVLPYHRGPILSGDESSSIAVYIIWYGTFGESQRSTIVDFLGSFAQQDEVVPTVSSWWKTTRSYRDAHGDSVMPRVHLAGQTLDDYSKGKSLAESDLEELVKKYLSEFPADSKSVYFVFTAEDVFVQSFCMNSCGSHYSTAASTETRNQQLPYSWVGNAASQCAGRCAWPFAKPMYGPQTEPLVAPNGDVGIDGMVINIATLLAGIATNPYANAYYQGDGSAPLESGTSCAGKFGEGAYPGYPGTLLLEKVTGASYNAIGTNGRKYLLPALWDPSTLACKSPFVSEIAVEGFDLQGSTYTEM